MTIDEDGDEVAETTYRVFAGIGLACARLFLERGDRVVAQYRLHPEPVRRLVAEFGTAGVVAGDLVPAPAAVIGQHLGRDGRVEEAIAEHGVGDDDELARRLHPRRDDRADLLRPEGADGQRTDDQGVPGGAGAALLVLVPPLALGLALAVPAAADYVKLKGGGYVKGEAVSYDESSGELTFETAEFRLEGRELHPAALRQA